MQIKTIRYVVQLSLVSSIRLLGLFMLLPVLPEYAKKIDGATPTLIGIALGIYGFPQALLQIPAGKLSDHIGRKPVIITGLLIFAFGSIIAAFSNHIVGIIIGRFFQGMGAISSVITAFMADITSDKMRTRSMAILGMSIGISFCASMFLGPLIAESYGLFGVFSTAFILCVIALMIIISMPQSNQLFLNKSNHSIWINIQEAFNNKRLISPLLGTFFLHFTLMGLFMSLPEVFKNLHSSVNRSFVFLVVLVVSFIFMLPFLILSERKNKQIEFILAAILVLMSSIFTLWLNVHANTGIFMIELFLYFVAFNFLEANLPSLTSKLAPADKKGITMGIYSSFQFMGAGLGGTCSGLSIQYFGIKSPLAMNGVIIVCWFLLTYLNQKRIKH